jgi:hypothetical protein
VRNLRGLSFDDVRIMKKSYNGFVKYSFREEVLYQELKYYPSIQFGIEIAFLSLKVKIHSNYFHHLQILKDQWYKRLIWMERNRNAAIKLR